MSFYIYSHCVSIPKKCTRRDKYIVTKESFSPVSELYTTVMSLVINSQELDNLSPHLSYLISFSAPFFFAKWPISNLIVSCTLFNLNLQLRVQLTCSLVLPIYIILSLPQLVFSKYISLVFLFLLLEIDIEMTISESSQLWQYSNAFSNCSFERTNNRSQREIKGEMKSLVPTFQSEKEEREVHNRPKYEKIQLTLAQLDST